MQRIFLVILVACGSGESRHGAGVARSPTSSVPSVDFDGDGLADLAFPGVEDGAEIVAMYLGRDHGKLSQRLVIATHPADQDRSTAGHVQRLGAAGDLDGDGRAELALIWGQGAREQLLLMRGTPDGLDRTPYQRIDLSAAGDEPWYDLDPHGAGDVDGDGRADLVIGDALLRGTGGGRLAPPRRIELPGGVHIVHPVGDVDGDGTADLVATSPSWAGEPPRALLVAESTMRELPVDPIATVADLDGDGVCELIGQRDGHVTVYGWQHGLPAARSTVDIPLAPHGGEIHQVAVLGGELVVVTSSRTVELICDTRCVRPAGFQLTIVQGDRIVATRTESKPSPVTMWPDQGDPQPYVLSPGDFDGDGVADLVVAIDHRVVIHQSKLSDATIDAQVSPQLALDVTGAAPAP